MLALDAIILIFAQQEIMKLTVTENLKVTGWIPGIFNPVHAGHYQRDRRTQTPRPSEYFRPEDSERFLALYPPPKNTAPTIGKVIDLEYWDGHTWWLSSDIGFRTIRSYEGAGAERHYWRGIEYDESQHKETFSNNENDLTGESDWHLTEKGWELGNQVLRFRCTSNYQGIYVAKYVYKDKGLNTTELVEVKPEKEADHIRLLKKYGVCPQRHT